MEKDLNEEAMLNDIASRLLTFGKEMGNLIPILQMIHERHAFLHPDAIKMVGEYLDMAVGRGGRAGVADPKSSGTVTVAHGALFVARLSRL